MNCVLLLRNSEMYDIIRTILTMYDDKENDVYYLDEYNKGGITRTEYAKEEFKDSVYSLGLFWRPYGDTGVVEAKYMEME